MRTRTSPSAAPGVLGNDTDVVADALSVGEVNGSAANVGTEITLASGALVTLNANGSYTYKPNGAFEHLDTGESTTDSFTYKASDGVALSNSATVTITINGVNDAPVAADTSASVGHLDSAGVDVTLSATDADGDSLTFAIVASPSNGVLDPIGSVTCTGATPNVVLGHGPLHAELAERRFRRRRHVHLPGERRHRRQQHRDRDRHADECRPDGDRRIDARQPDHEPDPHGDRLRPTTPMATRPGHLRLEERRNRRPDARADREPDRHARPLHRQQWRQG